MGLLNWLKSVQSGLSYYFMDAVVLSIVEKK